MSREYAHLCVVIAATEIPGTSLVSMFMFVSVIRSRVIRAGHDDNEDGDCSLKLKHQLGTMLLNTDK